MAGLSDLKISEINIIARRIKGDPYQAVAEGTEHRWTCLALAQWLHARRTDPHADEARYMEMTPGELTALEDSDEGDDEDTENPTAPEPSQA